jgi:nucleotide-binding universal stress UspA family protein
MFNSILLAIDDSPSVPAAVSFAIAMANDSGASVHVVHVNEFLVGGRGHTVESPQEAARVLDEAVSELRAAGVAATGVVLTSNCFNVSRHIAAVARDKAADVIVVGSRRRSRLGGLRGTGIREKITGLTPLPVVTAPPPLKVGGRGRLALGKVAIPRAPKRTAVSRSAR